MSTGSKRIVDLQSADVLDEKDEIIFYQNSTKKTKKITRERMLGSRGIVVKGKFIDPEGNDVGLAAAAAANDAATALVTAQGAQDTADGKNRIFYSDDAPTNPTGTYDLKENDIWYDTNNGYKMSKWTGSTWQAYQLDDPALAGLNVGKLTAGFISSQVISILGTTANSTQPAQCSGFIESSNFVPTWVSGIMTVRQYQTTGQYASTLGKQSASDVVQVKVLQGDGSYKLFRSLTDQGANATGAPPSSGSNGNWQEITGGSIPTITLDIGNGITKVVQNFGFRIVANGYAEFGGALFRGAVIANEGYFGDKVNAVRVDDDGLTIGNFGRIKSAGIGYNGTDFTSTDESGGFFLGNTQAENQDELYQFFIGTPGANNLRWDGTNLLVNGQLTAGILDGENEDTNAGLTITSGFGIRRSGKDKVLTITGGQGNGITNGAQIDLVGTEFAGAGGNAEGQLILSAGYDSTLSPFDPSVDGCIIFRTSRESGNVNIGAQRFRIDLDGTVRVISAGNVYSGAPNSGAGKLVVDNQVKIGNGINGVLEIGNADNDTLITMTGEFGQIQAESFTSTSSKRFKKNIKNLKGGLDIVNSLRPVTFDWKKKDKKNDIGLIAEEVYKILPNIVGVDEKNKPSGLDYGKLTTILIQAVKELAVEVERLKNKI